MVGQKKSLENIKYSSIHTGKQILVKYVYS